jgi:hypothetical protein
MGASLPLLTLPMPVLNPFFAINCPAELETILQTISPDWRELCAFSKVMVIESDSSEFPVGKRLDYNEYRNLLRHGERGVRAIGGSHVIVEKLRSQPNIYEHVRPEWYFLSVLPWPSAEVQARLQVTEFYDRIRTVVEAYPRIMESTPYPEFAEHMLLTIEEAIRNALFKAMVTADTETLCQLFALRGRSSDAK